MKSSSSITSMRNKEIRLNEGKTYCETYCSLSMPEPKAEQIGNMISEVLAKMVSDNAGCCPPKSLFHSKVVPGISIQKYLERLTRASRCSSETYLLALIYIDRYLEKQDCQALIDKNVHKLYFISLVIAAKFNDDLKLANSAFAHIGGMNKSDLCILEVQFLRAIEFNVYVSSAEYVTYLRSVAEFGT